MLCSTLLLAASAGNLVYATTFEDRISGLQKRYPSDTSGETQVAYRCIQHTFPDQGGTDEAGGYSVSSAVFRVTTKAGVTINGTDCHSYHYDNTCTFNDPSFTETIVATGSFIPQGGTCSLRFTYNGYEYHGGNQLSRTYPEPYCGSANEFQPFGDDATALCFVQDDAYPYNTPYTTSYEVTQTPELTSYTTTTDIFQVTGFTEGTQTITETVATCSESPNSYCFDPVTLSTSIGYTTLLRSSSTAAAPPSPPPSSTPTSSPTQDGGNPPPASSDTGVPTDVELRILPLGDSITWGYCSSDGNGYRLRLQDDLSFYNVTYAGTVAHGNMADNWCDGYPGHTIQYIADEMDAALQQKPNIVCLLAGTNDMNPDPAISQEGSDPAAAIGRLTSMVNQIFDAIPDSVVLIGSLPGVVDSAQHQSNTDAFNNLVPGLVFDQLSAGHKAVYVSFDSVVGTECGGVHPSDQGYIQMGDIWHDAINSLPSNWVNQPIGPDPVRPAHSGGSGDVSTGANGGPDPNIPAPQFATGPLQCEIATGIGHPGDHHFSKNWVEAGQQASGIGRDGAGVRLHDMDGDGKADYLWLDPDSGELICYKNNYPDLYTPCGTNGGVIASGAGSRDQVFFADMNGNGKADYLVVSGDSGQVVVYWNEGPDDSAVNGWRFNPGGVIATGVPHANLATLRFPDINGDGRADYVIIGEGGSLGLWLNTGQQGSYDLVFVAQGGIASGAASDLSHIELADINGDGRADYLIWDDNAGLSGFLNIRTRKEGTPFFADQGGSKVIADGIGQAPSSIRLADHDGDGLLDYCYIDDNGALFLWFNRGTGDASVTGDGVRMADFDGDHIDDYVWIEAASGQPTLYLNAGPDEGAPDGWLFTNQGVIASGAGPRDLVHFADIDGDNRTDYLITDRTTGALTAYLNGGHDTTAANNWRFNPVGQIASGLGPGVNARFGDIDGDGKADWIQLMAGGKTNIWKNNYPGDWSPLPDANAAGIGQPPNQIQFADVDNDGKVDYIWTDPFTGQPHVYYNKFPSQPVWVAGPYPDATSEDVSGACVIFGRVAEDAGAQAVFVNPDTGGISAYTDGKQSC